MQIARNTLDTQAGPSNWFTGAVYYRLLVSHAALDSAHADTLIGQVFPAFGRRPE